MDRSLVLEQGKLVRAELAHQPEAPAKLAPLMLVALTRPSVTKLVTHELSECPGSFGPASGYDNLISFCSCAPMRTKLEQTSEKREIGDHVDQGCGGGRGS